MAETIICPKCGCDVTEVLSVQLKAQIRQDVALEWRDREAELAKEKTAIESQCEALAKERLAIDHEVDRRMVVAKKRFKAKAIQKAREAMSAELKVTQAELSDVQAKLQLARDTELQLRKERQKLEEEKQNLELTVTRQLDAERASIRDDAKKQADEEHRLKFAEYEKRISDMNKELDDARRIAGQGSQQLQGEVLELDLETIVRREFSIDDIKPVPKGIPGSDIIHVVRDSSGADCGTIIWESKRAKNWSNTWLQKLRKDQRDANACFAVLVSEELPESVTTFAFIEGIWVTNRACCIGLAIALRSHLLALADARRALDGRHGKMEIVYNYLSSSAFRNRVQGIVEAFATLHKDLNEEKRAMTARWSKREKQINQALIHTSGMYGDLQGIIGGSLPVVDSLEFAALPSPDGESEEETANGVLPR